MTLGAVLGPLAGRHAHWMSLNADEIRGDRDEAQADVRAMQLILRMERSAPPVWSEALTAACVAATAVCLDDRAADGGEWHRAVAEYVGAHIRKVTRRARGSHWDAVQDMPGVTVTVGGTVVRALVPGPVTDLDKRVSKLQVGGTDVAVDLEPGGSLPAVAGALQLSVPEHVPMTAGKLMAQTGHAGMITAALLAGSAPSALVGWRDAGMPVVVRRMAEGAWNELLAAAESRDAWAGRLVAVRDAGFTEIDPGTVSVIADATAM